MQRGCDAGVEVRLELNPGDSALNSRATFQPCAASVALELSALSPQLCLVFVLVLSARRG